MRRITLWVLSTLSALVLLFGYSTSTSGPLATSSATFVESSPRGTSSSGTSPRGTSSSGTSSSGSGSATPSGGAASASPTARATAQPSTTATAQAKPQPTSSTATGEVADTRWGPVQVELTVVGGKITKVTVLQYPNGNPKDAEINDYALPVLTQETVQAQNASIDMVSGATVTSDGYLQSLQSALDKAGL